MSSKSNLIKALYLVENLSDQIDWYRLEETDEGEYDNLNEDKSEAYDILTQIQDSLSQEKSIYQVKQVCSNEPSKCFDMVLRLDALVEQYPFLTEAFVFFGLDEMSFLDKANSISVQIKKVK